MSDTSENPQPVKPMRRVLGRFGLLMKGRGVAAIMTFAATAIMARALGPEEFGRLVLVQTYALLIRGLFKFRLFEAIVTFGTALFDAGDHLTLNRLVHACRSVDRLTSISATLVAVIAAPFVGSLLNLDQLHTILLTAFSLVLLTSGVGTANGVLRLFDQFDVLGTQMIVSASIRLVGVTLFFWLPDPTIAFICVLGLAAVSEDLYLKWCGRKEYDKRVTPPVSIDAVKDAKLAEFSGLKSFLWITYWQSNIDLVTRRASVLLAGYILGPTEAGLLRLARQFASILAKPATLLRQVVYLDLTRSWNDKSDDFTTIVFQTSLLAGISGMLFVVLGYFFGDVLLTTIVGEEFTAGGVILTLLLVASTFDLVASPLRSAAYAMGYAGKLLRVYAISALIYLILFTWLANDFGLIGVGVSAIVSAALPPLAMAMLIRQGALAESSEKEPIL